MLHKKNIQPPKYLPKILPCFHVFYVFLWKFWIELRKITSHSSFPFHYIIVRYLLQQHWSKAHIDENIRPSAVGQYYKKWVKHNQTKNMKCIWTKIYNNNNNNNNNKNTRKSKNNKWYIRLARQLYGANLSLEYFLRGVGELIDNKY